VENTTVSGTTQTTKQDIVGATFTKITYSGNQQVLGSQIDVNAYGSCTVSFSVPGQAASTGLGSIQYLDAGPSLTVNLPSGTSKNIPKLTAAGILGYSAELDQTATTFTAGDYQIIGPGGPDVGPFSDKYTMPQPFAWTNQSAITTVVRSTGATVNWSGGDPSGYVLITGGSTTPGNAATRASAAFTCTARDSDGTFTVPPVVLLALPAASGSLSLTHVTASLAYTPPSGVEFFGISSVFEYGSSVTYQ
jgi:hypothetical protein